MKPGACDAQTDGEKRSGVFVWEDKTCSDFKPKQKPEQKPEQKLEQKSE